MSKKKEDSVQEVNTNPEAEQETANQQNATQDTPQTETQPEAELTEEEKLNQQLAEALLAQADLKDKYLRQVAEFDNYRKRTIKEKAELIKNASADILTKLLPIIDDFERALEAIRKTDGADAITEGVELIYNKLFKMMSDQGLTKIPATGIPFDTDVHEAIAMIPAQSEKDKGMVVDCTRQGYKLNDTVIRVAQVVVAN